MLNSVKTLVSQKNASIAAQSQTFSPLIGAFSLFGLFALIFSQQDLRALFADLENRLGSDFIGWSIFLFAFVIIAVFFLSARYFVRVFVSLRVLEIVLILVERQLGSVPQTPPSIKGFEYSNGLYIPTNSLKKQ